MTRIKPWWLPAVLAARLQAMPGSGRERRPRHTINALIMKDFSSRTRWPAACSPQDVFVPDEGIALAKVVSDPVALRPVRDPAPGRQAPAAGPIRPPPGEPTLPQSPQAQP